MREYSICAMANGSLPSMSGVLAGVCGVFGGLGSSAPRFTRDADGTRSTAAEPQVGQASSLLSFCEAKSPAEPNQPSNRWPIAQSRSKTIIWHILQCRHDRRPDRGQVDRPVRRGLCPLQGDRKSTRLNSSHLVISYAVFCL